MLINKTKMESYALNEEPPLLIVSNKFVIFDHSAVLSLALNEDSSFVFEIKNDRLFFECCKADGFRLKFQNSASVFEVKNIGPVSIEFQKAYAYIPYFLDLLKEEKLVNKDTEHAMFHFSKIEKNKYELLMLKK